MKLARTSISMRQDLMTDAQQRQAELRLASFSDYIQQLIRDDLARQSDRLHDAPTPAPQPPAAPVTYTKPRRPKK